MFRHMVMVVVSLLSMVSTSYAERSLDIVSGNVSTASTDVYVERRYVLGSPDKETRNVNFGDTSYLGARYTWWGEQQPHLGIAGEVSYYSVEDGQSVDLDILTLSFQGLVRGRLYTSEMFPNGRLQPYLGAGVFYATADVSIDFRPEIPSVVDGLSEDMTIGFMLGAKFQITERIGLFIERRDIDFGLSDEGESFLSNESVRVKLDSTYSLLGISWNF